MAFASNAEISTQDPMSPRNHWRVLADAFEKLSSGDARGAWRDVQFVRHSQMIPAAAIAEAQAMIAKVLKTNGTTLADLPSDYLRDQPGRQIPRPLSRFDRAWRKPENTPPDMVLPPLIGNGNDFGFISETVKHAGSDGPMPQRRVKLVFHLQTSDDVNELARRLQDAQRTLQTISQLELVVFAPASCHGRDLPLPTQWVAGTVWQQEAADQIRVLADDTDLIAFMPGEALADPLLFERALRYSAVNDILCMALVPLTQFESHPSNPDQTVLNQKKHNERWIDDPFAFRLVKRLDLMVPAKLFRAIGGFSRDYQDSEYAVRDFAFRAYNSGAYFMPLAVRADWITTAAETPPPDADKKTFIQRCPHPRERTKRGRFDVPKVSIYIPAFRAARYLRDAIDSVLSQDFKDLEVCVADDGSPDSTLEVLKSYEKDPRVRWISGKNGGIGHASNRAIRMSRGLYIGQLDSDDRLKPGAIRQLVEILDKNPEIGCAYGSCERIDGKGDWLQLEYSYPNFSREKMVTTSIVHHFRMFRRQVWMRTEGFREDITNAVDYDIFLKMSEITEFEHLEELLYQRRWHGRNTSIVNEGRQTQNTYLVQRNSLERRGLNKVWDVHIRDPKLPRSVTYKRKAGTERVFFWPDYSGANPYQRLLYGASSRKAEFIGTNPEAFVKMLRMEREEGRAVFHIHWLNSAFAEAENVGDAIDASRELIDQLNFMKYCGVRIVWTIHNIVSHDTPFAGIEIKLAKQVIDLADCIHVHSEASLPEIEKHYQIPREKLHFARHGAYINAYPDYLTPAQARAELGIDPDDQVMLFLGQVRPYKGLSDLVESFRALLPDNPKLRLVLAGGRGSVDDMLDELDLTEAEKDRLTIVNRFLDDSELQLFFRSADFAVFPYRHILTSGSLLLSLSFDVPVLIPDYAMPAQLLSDGKAGMTYSRDGGPEALTDAIRSMLQRLSDGQGPAMAKAARECAMAYSWEDISPMLFGAENTNSGDSHE